MRWANENAYDALIDEAVKTCNDPRVTKPLVKAIIGVESGFNPRAYRAEVAIGDASRGLMQLLLRTARAAGFTGSPEQLFDPATNITYGVRYLCDLMRRKGDLWTAVSAYNNGHGRRATQPTTVCLARDQQGKCVRYFTAQPGQFLNQPYVDKVMAAYKYFVGGDEKPDNMRVLGALIVMGTVLGRKWNLW